MLLFPSGGVAPEPGAVILKAGEYAELTAAGELLARAGERAAAVSLQAEADAGRRLREGYEEGLRQGRDEAAGQMFEAITASVEQLAGMESALVKVVMQSLRTILGEFDREDLVARTVAHALRLVRDEKRIVLRVSPEDVPRVEARLDGMLKRYTGIGRIDVTADAGVSSGGCVIETEVGVIDATLDRQLEIIEATFRRHLEERRS
ncbi:MAG: HrpE/YscL family type III secretion apparatus protein [Planctomycetota bacterium]|jgi:type III secretion protein L|nr:HrpE/YscL family type III secretion apparatus protein [Planctomycetota bacterium]